MCGKNSGAATRQVLVSSMATSVGSPGCVASLDSTLFEGLEEETPDTAVFLPPKLTYRQ